MMRPSPDLTEVHLCTAPIDFRKGIDGLATLVRGELGLDPFRVALFVFTNRSRNRVKILYWEKNGFCLWQKRLEKGRFHWLKADRTDVKAITGQQLNWLLDGYDIQRLIPHEKLNFSTIY